MCCLYLGQSINLSCVSSLRTQKPFLVVVQDILSARWILGLVFHLGFQTPSMKCHSSHTLSVSEILHMVVNALTQYWRLNEESPVRAMRWGLTWFGLIFLKPCVKFRTASSDLLKISCNLPVTVCCVTMLHKWCKSTAVLPKCEFMTA